MSLRAYAPRAAPAAIREIFEAPKLSLERAPVLFAVFERTADMLGDGMRALCTPRCTFALEAVTMGGSSDLVSVCNKGLCGVFRCSEWDAGVLIGVDREFVHNSMEALFGGDGTEQADRLRPISTIETRALRHVLELIAGKFGAGFAPIEAITLQLERIETTIDATTIGGESAPSVVARLTMAVQGGIGAIFIVVPQSALALHHKRLEREPVPDTGVQDPDWTRSLLAEIGRADVKLEVVLPGPCLSLQDVSELRPGQIMRLPATRDTPAELECSGKPIYRCRLAQSEGRFAVAMEESIDEQRELIGGLLAETKAT